ncbi:hypothetical protein LEMLEM_LOCUS18545, partial [Lemmus lemmus]
ITEDTQESRPLDSVVLCSLQGHHPSKWLRVLWVIEGSGERSAMLPPDQEGLSK